MTTELEDQLRAGMERFTGQVQVPPGLARRALRRRRRRTAVTIATATGIAVAVTGTAVAVPAMTRNAGDGKVRATADLASRISHAVTGAGVGDVEHGTTVITSSRHPVTTFTWGYGVSTAPDTRWPVTRLSGWSYGSQATITGYTPAGRAVVTEQTKATGITQVIYPARVWWHAQKHSGGAQPAGCSMMTDPLGIGDAGGWPGLIHSMVGCGRFRVTGRDWVSGTDTIKVSNVTADGAGETLWVDPATYLPIRLMIVMLPGYTVRTDLQWLPATSANLAQLSAVIPAGFRRTAAPGWTR